MCLIALSTHNILQRKGRSENVLTCRGKGDNGGVRLCWGVVVDRSAHTHDVSEERGTGPWGTRPLLPFLQANRSYCLPSSHVLGALLSTSCGIGAIIRSFHRGEKWAVETAVRQEQAEKTHSHQDRLCYVAGTSKSTRPLT